MTEEEREAWRQAYLNEPGTMPPSPAPGAVPDRPPAQAPEMLPPPARIPE